MLPGPRPLVHSRQTAPSGRCRAREAFPTPAVGQPGIRDNAQPSLNMASLAAQLNGWRPPRPRSGQAPSARVSTRASCPRHNARSPHWLQAGHAGGMMVDHLRRDEDLGITEPKGIELSVSDYAQIGSLEELLRLTPGLHVSRIPGQAAPGEQGTLDVITVLASSSGLVAAVRMLPEFLRSRRSGLSITTTVRDKVVVLKATNVDDVMPILERLLDD